MGVFVMDTKAVLLHSRQERSNERSNMVILGNVLFLRCILPGMLRGGAKKKIADITMSYSKKADNQKTSKTFFCFPLAKILRAREAMHHPPAIITRDVA
jgi:hypothetical protein